MEICSRFTGILIGVNPFSIKSRWIFMKNFV